MVFWPPKVTSQALQGGNMPKMGLPIYLPQLQSTLLVGTAQDQTSVAALQTQFQMILWMMNRNKIEKNSEKQKSHRKNEKICVFWDCHDYIWQPEKLWPKDTLMLTSSCMVDLETIYINTRHQPCELSSLPWSRHKKCAQRNVRKGSVGTWVFVGFCLHSLYQFMEKSVVFCSHVLIQSYLFGPRLFHLALYNFSDTRWGWWTASEKMEEDFSGRCHHGHGCYFQSLSTQLPKSPMWGNASRMVVCCSTSPQQKYPMESAQKFILSFCAQDATLSFHQFSARNNCETTGALRCNPQAAKALCQSIAKQFPQITQQAQALQAITSNR